MTKKNPQYLIFSDLDGTLLDHDTYSFHEAREALLGLKNKGIPLILCSSKTRAEMEGLRRELDNHDPFITENGAAVFIPRGLFGPLDLKYLDLKYKEVEGYEVVELGIPYNKIKALFKKIKAETGLRAKGFSEMSPEQIAGVTGLDLGKAALAGQREYSEPFLLTEEIPGNRWLLIEQAVQKKKLTLTRGGRFYHLTGPNDKGKAVRLLINLYQKINRSIVSIGLGDSPNDFPMLENVDLPVLIKKKTGHLEPWPGLTPVYHSREIGPKGWNEFVNHFLKEAGHE